MADKISPISTLPPFLFASALSAYGLYLCKENITRLQEYEEQSEKVAEWSNAAAQRLRKTRTTQTSGTISLLFSLITSTALPFLTSKHTPTVLGVTGLATGAILYAARTHMANFWNEEKQIRIPFVEKFNDAIRGSEKVVLILETLSFSWGVAGCIWALSWGGLGLGIWAGVAGGRTAWMFNQGWATSF